MNQEKEKPVKGVETVSKTFTAKEADGSVKITFKLDSAKLEGKSVVAFEKLFYGETEIAHHEDLEDESQTVNFPKIRTNATGTNGEKELTVTNESLTVIDTVTYENLTPDQKYTLKGTLMDKKTGKPAKAAGKEITAEETFTPSERDGKVELSFTFNAKDMSGDYVVFEKLYDAEEDKLVATHEDLKDEDQTVTIKQQPKEGTPGSGTSIAKSVKTGIQDNYIWIVLALMACAGVAGFVFWKKKKQA